MLSLLSTLLPLFCKVWMLFTLPLSLYALIESGSCTEGGTDTVSSSNTAISCEGGTLNNKFSVWLLSSEALKSEKVLKFQNVYHRVIV